MKNQKHFFLISFVPALAYWYLEMNYSLAIALSGGMILALLEVILERVFTGHVHAISKFNLLLIGFLGSTSLIASDGIWFKLQPCFTGIFMGAYLLWVKFQGKSLLFDIATAMNNQELSFELVSWMERNMGIFMLCYGVFMGAVAFHLTTSRWLFFKTGGFYIAFFVFSILQVIWIRTKKAKNL